MRTLVQPRSASLWSINGDFHFLSAEWVKLAHAKLAIWSLKSGRETGVRYWKGLTIKKRAFGQNFEWCFDLHNHYSNNVIVYTDNDFILTCAMAITSRVEIPLKNRWRFELFEWFSSKIWAVWAVFLEKSLKSWFKKLCLLMMAGWWNFGCRKCISATHFGRKISRGPRLGNIKKIARQFY